MKALVYHGPGAKAWEDVPDPKIEQATDVIVKMDTTTICGTDLHILKGDVATVAAGRILGHEGVGTITEIGSAVSDLNVGDQVILSCISACGHCDFCKRGVYSHCLGSEGASGIGWIFGHLIDGTQAEYVRVPYAETSVYKLPAGVSPQLGTLLSDILPTGHEIGLQYGQIKAGDVVAVIGAGPVGLAAIATAAVGIPATFTMCIDIVLPAGHGANVGVHGKPVELALQDLWISNIVISMGLVNTNTLGTLLKLVAQQKIPAEHFISHTFALDDILDAYDVFGRAAETKALKVMINA